jgi:hypothetical protein
VEFKWFESNEVAHNFSRPGRIDIWTNSMIPVLAPWVVPGREIVQRRILYLPYAHRN